MRCDDNSPACAVLMVVHNAREMVRLATLKTLRHTAQQDVRFVVVDGGSNDGSDVWLRLLAERGDVDLIRAKGNIGHGPGLELARRSSRSRFIVTLDSDAFPLANDWLDRLSCRLGGNIKAAGIRHHRDYIHPSCLMLERNTLDEMQLSYLDEKGTPSAFDVAERISVELKARGFGIEGLQRTSYLRRGSVSEPVDIGVTYEDMVYHHWYTTRSVLAGGGPVDDVCPGAIDGSLEDLFSAANAEPREATIIVGVRAKPDEPDRAQNAAACLRALNLQDVARWRYRIVVVEQDSEARLKDLLAPYADRYCFAYNPGLYNRGWGFNAGAAFTPSAGALCLIDADLIVPPGFVARALEEFAHGKHAFLPYHEMLYLDAPSTARALAGEETLQATGQLFRDSRGGAIWVSASLYKASGGYDERFQGWGYEDREFYNRLNRIAGVDRLSGRLHHLHHKRRDPTGSAWVVANAALFRDIENGRGGPATGERGDLQRYGGGSSSLAGSGAASKPARDWQNWHAWGPGRIRAILTAELNCGPNSSPRSALAAHVVRLGNSVLDAGCGPGALWPRLREHREKLECVGVDVTHEMLSVARGEFPDIPVCCADAARLPFPDSRFDVVLLRHVLEHLPEALMAEALSDAMRVARKAVVLDFHLRPVRTGSRQSRRVPGNFIETRWTAADLLDPAERARWRLRERFALRPQASEDNEIWVLEPLDEELVYSAGPKVSIIMPTYRRPHTLMRTIEAVRSQRYSNWQLLVADNSGDGAYAFGDPRIEVLTVTERASASYARNAALRHAAGDLVCFFDDDDDMFPDYLEKFVAAFEAHPGAKMVRCGMIVDGGGHNYTYATPECCIRREFATPTWYSCDCHDQVYFREIAERNGWTIENGEIVMIREALCRANSDRTGGLREGGL